MPEIYLMWSRACHNMMQLQEAVAGSLLCIEANNSLILLKT
jgi:hypothetical protein